LSPFFVHFCEEIVSKSLSFNFSDVDANVMAKDVMLGSRPNINFLHEVFRRALLMSFVNTVAIRRVITVYKDWIQMNVRKYINRSWWNALLRLVRLD